MAIFYAEYILGGEIKGSFPKIMFLFFVQKSRWPYSMQNKFGMEKIQGVISWSGYMYYSLPEYISHCLKKVTDDL